MNFTFRNLWLLPPIAVASLLVSLSSIGTQSAVADELSPLPMEALALTVPTNVAGVNPNKLTNAFHVTGWINTNTAIVITATNGNPPGYSNVAPFVMIQRLLQAYQTADVQAVQSLYDLDSRQIISSTLADPEIASRWSGFVTNVERIVPLVIWNETNRVFAITWALQRSATADSTNGLYLPFVFDTNYNLMADEMTSSVSSDLSLYFADGTRSPNGLIPTNSPSANSLRKK